MASFTDEIQKFNPYIEQLPVDDYIKVGMTKQGQYDQNVQQAQTAITSVASLDVPEKYKSYLQGALNALRDGVRNTLSGDFSDNQVLNQLTGAAKSIISDKIVQTGVQSAVQYRAQDELRKAAQKEGKSSRNNDAWLDEQYAAWAQNSDLSEGFTGKYMQYVDLPKKWMEIVKSMDPSGKLEQIPFVINADGSINTEQIANAMVERGIEGKSAEKIMNAIRSTISGDDMAQMQIDAHFAFKGTTPEQLVQKATQDFEKDINDKTKYLSRARQIRKTLDAKDARAAQLDEEIKLLEDALGADGKSGNLYLNFKDQVAAITQDPESAKARLYRDGFVRQFAAGFSSEKISQKYLDNPMRKQENWFADYAETKRMNDETIKQHGIDNQFKQADLDLKIEKAALEKNGGIPAGGIELAIGTEGTSAPAASFINENADLQNNLNASISDLATKQAGIGATPQEVAAQRTIIEQRIKDYREGQPAPEGNLGSVIVGLAEQQQQLEGRAQLLKKLDAKIDQQLGIGQNSAVEQTLKKHQPFTLSDGTSFTPKEITTYLMKEKYNANSQGAPGYTSVDLNSLSEKERKLYNTVRQGRYNTAVPSSNEFNKYLDSYQDVMLAGKQVLQQKTAAMDAALAPYLSQYKPRLYGTPMVDGKSSEAALGAVNQFVQRAKLDKMQNDGFDPSKVSAMVSGDGKEKTRVLIQSQGDSYQILVSKDGETTQRINASRKEIIDNFGEQYTTKNNDIVTNLRLGNGNTNLTGDPRHCFFGKKTMGQVKNLTVGADLEEALDGSGTYYINFNIKTPDGWQHFKSEIAAPSIDHALQVLSRVNDQTLWKRLLEVRPSVGQKYELDKNNQLVPKK